jgi:hypothetical protein
VADPKAMATKMATRTPKEGSIWGGASALLSKFALVKSSKADGNHYESTKGIPRAGKHVVDGQARSVLVKVAKAVQENLIQMDLDATEGELLKEEEKRRSFLRQRRLKAEKELEEKRKEAIREAMISASAAAGVTAGGGMDRFTEIQREARKMVDAQFGLLSNKDESSYDGDGKSPSGEEEGGAPPEFSSIVVQITQPCAIKVLKRKLAQCSELDDVRVYICYRGLILADEDMVPSDCVDEEDPRPDHNDVNQDGGGYLWAVDPGVVLEPSAGEEKSTAVDEDITTHTHEGKGDHERHSNLRREPTRSNWCEGVSTTSGQESKDAQEAELEAACGCLRLSSLSADGLPLPRRRFASIFPPSQDLVVRARLGEDGLHSTSSIQYGGARTTSCWWPQDEELYLPVVHADAMKQPLILEIWRVKAGAEDVLICSGPASVKAIARKQMRKKRKKRPTGFSSESASSHSIEAELVWVLGKSAGICPTATLSFKALFTPPPAPIVDSSAIDVNVDESKSTEEHDDDDFLGALLLDTSGLSSSLVSSERIQAELSRRADCFDLAAELKIIGCKRFANLLIEQGYGSKGAFCALTQERLSSHPIYARGHASKLILQHIQKLSGESQADLKSVNHAPASTHRPKRKHHLQTQPKSASTCEISGQHTSCCLKHSLRVLKERKQLKTAMRAEVWLKGEHVGTDRLILSAF